MALMYVSHSDEIERLVKIEKVKQEIAVNIEESSLQLTWFTNELNKFGQPKDFSFVEFVEKDAVQNSLILNEL